MRRTPACAFLIALALVMSGGIHAAGAQTLPPPVGPETPRVAPIKEEDGLYRQGWFETPFTVLTGILYLREDLNDAKAGGKRFAVIFEQRGCP